MLSWPHERFFSSLVFATVAHSARISLAIWWISVVVGVCMGVALRRATEGRGAEGGHSGQHLGCLRTVQGASGGAEGARCGCDARTLWCKSTWEDRETPPIPVGIFTNVSLDVCVGNVACLHVGKSVRCAWVDWCVLSQCCVCVCIS